MSFPHTSKYLESANTGKCDKLSGNFIRVGFWATPLVNEIETRSSHRTRLGPFSRICCRSRNFRRQLSCNRSGKIFWILRWLAKAAMGNFFLHSFSEYVGTEPVQEWDVLQKKFWARQSRTEDLLAICKLSQILDHHHYSPTWQDILSLKALTLRALNFIWHDEQFIK